MVPRIPRTKGKGVGTSFKGTAAYLLHDEGQAQTSDRVLWTDTRNLATDNPDQAWRVMAATAMDSDRLKRAHHEAEQAKLPEDERADYRSSKASKNHVFHYSLAWDGKTEGDTLTREEMTKAAYDSMRALGADHLQAMIVAHDSKTNPHVHVMLNRVNPETGRVETPESNAKYRLSEWALGYERDRGQVLCKVREENARLRENGLPFDQHTDQARPGYEAEKAVAGAAERNPEDAEKLRASLKGRIAEQAAVSRDMRERHEVEWTKLFKDHEFRKAMINQEADDGKGYADRAVRMSFVDRFDDLRKEQGRDQAQFVEREASFFGRLTNVGTAARQVWATRREEGGDDGLSTSNVIGETWNVMANSGARLEALKAAQEKAKASLDKDMQAEVKAAIDTVERGRKEAIHDN